MSSIQEISSIIDDIRQQRKRVLSNYYFNIEDTEDYETYVGKDSVVFIRNNITRNDVLFYTCNESECSKILKELPVGSVLSYVSKVEIDDFSVLNNTGFKLYSVQQRIGEQLSTYEEQKELMSKNRWDRFYDEQFGEYASEKDVDEIFDILLRSFDHVDDDFFSKNQLGELIKNNNIMIDRRDGTIKTLHIYQIQGKKFFSNHIYNEGWAGALYSIEKKALLKAIEDYGVTYRYGWIRLTNQAAWRRNTMAIENTFNYTYRKEF